MQCHCYVGPVNLGLGLGLGLALVGLGLGSDAVRCGN